MIARVLTREQLGTERLNGLVLTADLSDRAGQFVLAKGTTLCDADLVRLHQAEWDTLHVLVLASDDVHEAEAGRRLAQAVAGPGIVVGASTGGQWPLRSLHRGVLEVNAAGLAALHACEDLSVYTLYDGQVVDGQETVARAKIVPFAVPQATMALGERRAAELAPLLAVRPFHPCRVSALVQESLSGRARERFQEAFGEKVAWFGGVLNEPLHVRPERGEVGDALATLLASGPDLLVVAGSRAMDPLDPIYSALATVGATMIRRGMPAHPGSLCWVARGGATSIVGMPSCGVFSRATVFDLLLTWVFAGVSLDAPRLAQVGHGGFLTRDMAFRFPPYRHARDRGEVE